VDEADRGLRNATYALVAELGRVPTAEEAAQATGLGLEDVRARWRSLHEAHAIVLDDATGEIRMANPFSGVPTRFRVHADGRSWHANCAWDAFGIPILVGVDAVITTTCPDCEGRIVYRVEQRKLVDAHGVVHFAVPAAKWWDDIGYT